MKTTPNCNQSEVITGKVQPGKSTTVGGAPGFPWRTILSMAVTRSFQRDALRRTESLGKFDTLVATITNHTWPKIFEVKSGQGSAFVGQVSWFSSPGVMAVEVCELMKCIVLHFLISSCLFGKLEIRPVTVCGRRWRRKIPVLRCDVHWKPYDGGQKTRGCFVDIMQFNYTPAT